MNKLHLHPDLNKPNFKTDSIGETWILTSIIGTMIMFIFAHDI